MSTQIQITDEAVKAWLHEQRNAAGIPSLVVWLTTEFKEDGYCAKIKDSCLYYGFGSTLSQAVERLRRQFPEAREQAKKLRDEARLKLKEAEIIEAAAGIVPALVIQDKEGASA